MMSDHEIIKHSHFTLHKHHLAWDKTIDNYAPYLYLPKHQIEIIYLCIFLYSFTKECIMCLLCTRCFTSFERYNVQNHKVWGPIRQMETSQNQLGVNQGGLSPAGDLSYKEGDTCIRPSPQVSKDDTAYS